MPPDDLPDFDQFWDYNDPSASEQKFRALQPPAEAAGNHAYHAQLLTQIARAQGLQRKFDAAHATLDRVEKLVEAQDLPPLPRVRCLLERGRVFNSSHHPDQARPLFAQAFALAASNHLDAFAIDAAHMLAIVEIEPRKQLEWNLRALDLAEKSDDGRAHRWRASLYNNIGWTWFQQQEYDRAMEVFEKAVVLRAEQNQPREFRIARYCVARTLRMQGRIDQAMQISQEIVEESEAAGEPDGFFLEELAECLLARGQMDEAKPHFRRAYEQLSADKWLSETEPARFERLRQLSY